MYSSGVDSAQVSPLTVTVNRDKRFDNDNPAPTKVAPKGRGKRAGLQREAPSCVAVSQQSPQVMTVDSSEGVGPAAPWGRHQTNTPRKCGSIATSLSPVSTIRSPIASSPWSSPQVQPEQDTRHVSPRARKARPQTDIALASPPPSSTRVNNNKGAIMSMIQSPRGQAKLAEITVKQENDAAKQQLNNHEEGASILPTRKIVRIAAREANLVSGDGFGLGTVKIEVKPNLEELASCGEPIMPSSMCRGEGYSCRVMLVDCRRWCGGPITPSSMCLGAGDSCSLPDITFRPRLTSPRSSGRPGKRKQQRNTVPPTAQLESVETGTALRSVVEHQGASQAEVCKTVAAVRDLRATVYPDGMTLPCSNIVKLISMGMVQRQVRTDVPNAGKTPIPCLRKAHVETSEQQQIQRTQPTQSTQPIQSTQQVQFQSPEQKETPCSEQTLVESAVRVDGTSPVSVMKEESVGSGSVPSSTTVEVPEYKDELLDSVMKKEVPCHADVPCPSEYRGLRKYCVLWKYRLLWKYRVLRKYRALWKYRVLRMYHVLTQLRYSHICSQTL